MDERERRVGQNEVMFREVNERIEDLNQAFGAITQTMVVVCECGRSDCTEQIEIGLADYERMRADPALLALVPGHEDEAVEDVVEQTPEYVVVRKRPGGPQQLAEATDPRA